ncbi:MAG: organic solvent resistance ABC transporter permease [Bdellovibrio sp. ArHS]|uniref:MlaE family ABC transporter permease n=1 Tax=Bdellovibrio sp. ArHS TaxID=1569284 RepID=UPI0005829C12|nr:ABC transporter permease [Bdellovibrio sp. ArHS]KHD88019.1 MAG: organic solvent resistance ABC transporter permease [Bdellovibrio sp. ArHS]
MTLLISILDEVGGALLFLKKILESLVRKQIKTHEVFEQIWKVTADSFFTTAMAGFFVGAIMTVQFALQMKEFGALGYLGGLATSGTFREVGPLLIAFMLSGKVGAFTSAELGTMRVTEQIDAVRCLGADPIQEIIAPRFLGIIISSFFLLGGGLIMSVFGGMLMGYAFAGVNFEEYLRHVPMIVSPVSILSGVIKCGAFALVLATICTFKGFTTTGGAKGVGRAVVATSVSTMICIVVVDWMTSFLGEVILQMIRGYRS